MAIPAWWRTELATSGCTSRWPKAAGRRARALRFRFLPAPPTRGAALRGRSGLRGTAAALHALALLLVAVLAAGCAQAPAGVIQDGAAAPAPGGAGPVAKAAETPGATVPFVLPDPWHTAGGLALRVEGVTFVANRVLVDVTVKNTAEGQRLLLLGGCGPSQGAVITRRQRYELYYRTSTGDDLTRGIPPGATKRAQVVLAFRSGIQADLDAVTGLEFHPGYVLDPEAGQLSYLEVRMSAPGALPETRNP